MHGPTPPTGNCPRPQAARHRRGSPSRRSRSWWSSLTPFRLLALGLPTGLLLQLGDDASQARLILGCWPGAFDHGMLPSPAPLEGFLDGYDVAFGHDDRIVIDRLVDELPTVVQQLIVTQRVVTHAAV